MPGEKIGHMRVTEFLATGGMGDAYAGYDEKLGRRVALKAIHPEHRLDAQAKDSDVAVPTGEATAPRPALGPKHPDLASGLMNLGDVLSALGDDTAARPHFERARFLDRLGGLTLKQGDTAAARRLYERSLALREKALGPGNHEVAGSLAGLADCARHEGRATEAATLYERSLPLSRKPERGYYPGTPDALEGYVGVLRASGQKARAAEMAALAATLRKPGP